jgi:anti-sigma B factor antagonist
MRIASRDREGILIFDIEGDIYRSSEMPTTVHEAVKSQLQQGRRNILLNMENVSSIDSYGVGEILASYVSVQDIGGKIKLLRISKKLSIVLKLVGLLGVFEVFDNETDAIQSFSRT